MFNFIKLIEKRNSDLPLDQQIFNEVTLILSFISILTSIGNFFLNLPLWFPIMFLFSAIVCFTLFYLNFYKGWFKFSKVVFIIAAYSLAIVGWTYSEGIHGYSVIFILSLTIFLSSFTRKKHFLLFLTNFLVFLSLAIINKIFPQTLLFFYPNEIVHLEDMVLSYFLISAAVVLVILTILKNYDKANDIVISQKAELEFLNEELIQVNEQLKSINNDLAVKNEQISNQSKELQDIIRSRDKLFSVIAHDLRSPFTSIIGFSDLLIERLEQYDAEKIGYMLEQINTSANNTLGVLNNLLAWAASQTGKLKFTPEKLDLQIIFDELMENPHAKLKNITLSFTQAENIDLYADTNMFKTIFRNLISNAIKFSYQNSRVEIFASKNPENIELTVTDFGTGMNNDTLNKIFKTDSDYSKAGTANEKGTGLGLILCREFVEKHCGNIRAESEEGKGTKFIVSFPAIKIS